MGELEGAACAMNSSQNLLLLLAFFAFACGQPRSARQDETKEQTEASEMLTEEDPEVAPEETPEPEPEGSGSPEPHPETEPEPEPEHEGSALSPDEKLEESDDMGQQTNTSKKCQKCFRSAFRARHSEFCDGCGETSSNQEADAKPLEKDADRVRRKCRRCSNPKFLEKHQNFCTIRCKDFIISEPTPTPEPEHRPITSDDLKKKKKKEKDRKKGERKTNKKNVELPEDKIDANSQLSIPLKDQSEEDELGPLGNLIKFIINQK